MKAINFTELLSEDPRIRYGCAKNLLAVAAEKPSEIYPDLDFFVKFLNGKNKVLKWTAIDIIGAVSRVDDADKVDKLIGKLFGLLNAGNMITANHAITALANIARAKPAYQTEITRELLRIEHYNYDTDECRNIAIGKVILAIGTYFNKLEDKEKTIEFVRRQTQNTRNATRKKAGQFLKKYNRQN